MLESEVLLC